MIYAAPCVMFLMRADTFRGQVGWGWALEIGGPVNWHQVDRRVPFGAQKTRDFQQCCGSGMFIPDPDFYPSRIPDLGSRIQKKQQKREVKKN
jgi:hypothetical protein